MKEPPLESILGLNQAALIIKEQLNPQAELFEDLTNYGANLVARAYGSSEKDYSSVVICAVLLKQIVSMLDAVTSLFRTGNVHAAFLPARAAYEASIYIDWILMAETDFKAKCYLVSNFRDKRRWALRGITGTFEETQFSQVASTGGLNLNVAHPELENEANIQLEAIDRFLAQPEYSAINRLFEKSKRKRRTNEPHWYEIAGSPSIRTIAKNVRRLVEYEIFYAKGSEVTHSASYEDHIKCGKHRSLTFKTVRTFEKTNEPVKFLTATAVHTFRKILEHYRPRELQAFNSKYLEDWRRPFFEVKEILYK